VTTPSSYYDELVPGTTKTYRGGAWELEAGRLPDGRYAVDHYSSAAPRRQRRYFATRHAAFGYAARGLRLRASLRRKGEAHDTEDADPRTCAADPGARPRARARRRSPPAGSGVAWAQITDAIVDRAAPYRAPFSLLPTGASETAIRRHYAVALERPAGTLELRLEGGSDA